MILTLSLAFAAECEQSASRNELLAALTDGDVAMVTTDVEGLRDAQVRARAVLPCLDQALLPDDVAWYFRVDGVADFVAGSPGANASFIAARALAPDYNLPSALGVPAQKLWAASVVLDGESAPLPRPREGWLLIDGARVSTAPVARAYMLQWVTQQGAQITARVEPGGPVPVYPQQIEESVVVVETPTEARAPRTSRPLALGAVASGLGAVACGLVSSSLRQQFLNSEVPSDQQSGTIAANRVTGGGAVALGAAAVGLGAGAVIVGRW